MIIDIKKVTKLCAKLEVTYTEFCFLYLLAVKDYYSVKLYVDKVEGFNLKLIRKLEKKGLLLNMNKATDVDDDGEPIMKPRLLHSTPTFDDLIKDETPQLELDEAYDELLNVYPYEFTGDDGSGGIKKFNARTANYEMYKFKYTQFIGADKDLHKKIVEATKYGKENQLIKVGLAKYIDGRMWGGIMEQMEQGFGGVSSDLE